MTAEMLAKLGGGMIHCLAALAQQADPAALAGASGWAGAGLLGLVLAWLLLKHLPEKDKQIKDLVADKDAQLTAKDIRMETVIGQFMDEVRDARREAAAVLGKEREQRHEERNQASADTMKMAVIITQNTATASAAVQEVRTMAQETRALAGAVSNLAEKVERA